MQPALEQRQEVFLVGMMQRERVGEEIDRRAGHGAAFRVEPARFDRQGKGAKGRELPFDAPMEPEERVDGIVEAGRKVVNSHSLKATGNA